MTVTERATDEGVDKPGTVPASARHSLASVTVLLLEPLELFETAVPTEVFGFDRTARGLPAFDYTMCTPEPHRPVRTSGSYPVGLTVRHGLEAMDDADLVIVAATDAREYPEAALEALRRAHARGAILLSVCTGAFILGAAGLLDGRPCVTHWRCAAELAERYPLADVCTDLLYVDDGQIITSAGTAAGIDACLHLVRRELGADVATQIARQMVVPPQRDGGQQQFIAAPMPPVQADRLAPLLEWLLANLDGEHTANSLARRAMMSPRTFARKFQSEVGMSPHRWLLKQRVIRARELLEMTRIPIEQVAERVGFGSATVLREHFRRDTGLSPKDYRTRFNCTD